MELQKRKDISPLTGIEVPVTESFETQFYTYEDPGCCVYGVDYPDLLRSQDKLNRNKIAMVLARNTVRNKMRQEKVPVILRAKGGINKDYDFFTSDELLEAFPSHPYLIFDEVLINLSYMLEGPGDVIELTTEDAWRLFAYNAPTAKYNLQQLQDAEFIRWDSAGVNFLQESVQIKAKGWERLQRLHSNSSPLNRVFVAMWFDDSMSEIYEQGIKPAIQEVGYESIKIDLVEHDEKICDRIISEIRKSKLLVADFTGNRGGVYYEAGFARGFNTPVVHLAKKGTELHFDIRQYNCIFYDTAEDLKERLKARIEANYPLQ